jgi:Flp pilus assembly pilin Flp
VTTLLRPLWIDQEGQDLAEYALLIVLIALIAAATLKTIGSSINNIFSNTASNLSAT